MSGFVSVLGSRRVAGVVARPLSCGWVWARRALPSGAGWHPAPACVFVPFGSFALASGFACGVSLLGWRVWVRDALIDGVDFGKIHVIHKSKCSAGKDCKNPAHFSKPSLFKPGAEKICGMLGVTVRYPTLNDYEKAALGGVNLNQIIIRCEILDASSRVVADGVGARIIAQDNGDINKALKMAEKSAHIDATLRMEGLSEVFIQRREVASIQQAEVAITRYDGITKTQCKQPPIKKLSRPRTVRLVSNTIPTATRQAWK